MKPKNIESIFTEYLGISNTQYALLIDGKWVTGKTFFWRKSLTVLRDGKNAFDLSISKSQLKEIESLR